MRTLAFLTKFFALKRLTSITALLLSLLTMLLLLSGFLSAAERTEGYAWAYEQLSGGNPVTFPVQDVGEGAVHAQVWEAANFAYLHSYPIIGGTLLPLRLSARWLFIILPFVGMLISACGVSLELETGVAQTLYGMPVHRAVLGMSRILGDSLAVTAMISFGILVALALGSQLVDYEITSVHLTRSAAFVLILGFYTSIFVQVGNLISAVSRRSAISLWVCVIVGSAIIGVYFSGANLMSTIHVPYSTLPAPPRTVSRVLSRQGPVGGPGEMSIEQFEEVGGPELARYILELNAHAEAFHKILRADYQRERWVALVSPVHAIWEVAQQLLQDRHNFSTELFAPIAAMDPPPSIRRSLVEAWPELTGLAVLWLLLFGLNIRVLSRLEV